MSGNLAYEDWAKEDIVDEEDESSGHIDGYPDELIDGYLVRKIRPFTNHAIVSGNIGCIFHQLMKCTTLEPIKNFGVHLTDKDVFIPDVAVAHDMSPIEEFSIRGAPDLVVEILAPATVKLIRGYKMRVYESCGVPEYWIVNHYDRSVEVYLLKDGRYELDNVYTLYSQHILDIMEDAEKATVIPEFKCHMCDDVVIRLEEIFEGMFDFKDG